MKWDLLVKGGTVVDPSQGLHGPSDVAVSAGKVARVGPGLDGSQALRVVDASGKLVTPGFVDIHTHNFVSGGSVAGGLPVDITCLANGATTVLDAGSATADEFLRFWQTDILPAAGRLLALVRIPFPGSGSAEALVARTAEAVRRHNDVLVGVKYHHSHTYLSLPLAREAADFSGGILMAEAYGAPIPHLLEYLKPGDVLTHTFHAAFRYPLFDHKGTVFPAVWEAIERGVHLDIGHGARGFAFRTLEQVLGQGLKPSTISTDLHAANVDGPVYDMPTTMSKLLAVGLPLDEVIEMSTATPAKVLRREGQIGTLKPGAVADIVVSQLVEGEFVYLDVLHEERVGKQRISPEVIICGGVIYDGKRYQPKEMSHKVSAPPGFAQEV